MTTNNPILPPLISFNFTSSNFNPLLLIIFSKTLRSNKLHVRGKFDQKVRFLSIRGRYESS